jgi:hypothetical protein
MRAVRVRWSTLARWMGGCLALLLALQALPPLLRPPAPEPLAADIGLPRFRAAKPATRAAGVARVWPARALPARPLADRRDSRGPTGRKHVHMAGNRPVGAESAVVAPLPETPTPPAPPPAAPAPDPAPAPPPGDGSVEFMPH